MKIESLFDYLAGNSYPGRGIVTGVTSDGKFAVSAYFIMGRSENSRNRVFVEPISTAATPAIRSPSALRALWR